MHEGSPNPIEPYEDQRNEAEKVASTIALTIELGETHEAFPFPGINPDSYPGLKAHDEEFPGYATPIDELVQRLETEGMKVILGNDPRSGNIYILPVGSNDIEKDSICPRHLQISGIMDEKLKELILIDRSLEKRH